MILIKNLLKKWICKGCLYKMPNPSRPKCIQTITLKKMKKIFKDKDILDVHFTDNLYSLTTLGQAKSFSRKTQVQDLIYYKEKFDCDDFSFTLKSHWCKGIEGFAFGIAWSKSHAFNIAIVLDDQKPELYIVEPQDNLWFKVEDLKENETYWPLRLVVL